MRRAAFSACLYLSAIAAYSGDVTLELVAPPQRTYVLGDKIPILWRFHNGTAQPLALFWEGCCFTYGELEMRNPAGVQARMKKPDQAQPFTQTLSPEEYERNRQAWHKLLAPTRIEPGASATFETELGNWVEIDGGGDFELRARYLGAPAAMLQRKDVKLPIWNGRVESAPIKLELLTPKQYLGKYAGSAAKDGFSARLELEQAALTPAQPLRLKVSIPADAKFEPERAALWILDARGQRLPVESSLDKFVRVAAADQTYAVEIPASTMIGQPLAANYSLFIDFEQAGAAPLQRRPSNAVQFSWQIGTADLRQLLKESAAAKNVQRTPRRGPLFTLRQHLMELRPLLDAEVAAPAPDAGPEYMALLRELSLAAALKPLAPKPGTLEIELREVDGKWLPVSKQVTDAFAWNSPATPEVLAERVGAILRVRNHLGATVSVRLTPHAESRLSALKAAAKALSATELLQYGQLRIGPARVSTTFSPSVVYQQTREGGQYGIPASAMAEAVAMALKDLRPATGKWTEQADLRAGHARILAFFADNLLWSAIGWDELTPLGEIELSLLPLPDKQ